MSEAIIKEKGSVTVEATLCVTLFMIFVLFMTTLFFMVSVQEDISHSLVQTADSLCLEAYSIDKLTTDLDTGAKAALTDLAVKLFSTANSDENFTTDKRWFSEEYLQLKYVEDTTMLTSKESLHTVDLAEVIRQRFVGFFANGDEDYADYYLSRMGVVDGLSGLDFSESKIDGGDLCITVKYKVKYLVNAGGLGEVNGSQTYRASIW